MLKIKKQRKTVKTITAKICDCCKTKIPYEDLRFDEFISISFQGGYTSVFGDGTKVEVDLCDICFKKLVGAHLRFN